MLMYNSNVKSVLLYGSESWRVVKADMRRLKFFHNGYLWCVCQIFWLGHVLRMEQKRCEDTKPLAVTVHRFWSPGRAELLETLSPSLWL